MARNTTQLIYQAIRIEGGLIPAAELARLTTLQTPDQTEQTDRHYRIPKGLKIRDEVARFWKIGQGLWSDFQSQRQRRDVDAHRATVRNFLVPLLRDVLGFSDIDSGATVEASGHSYNVGYAARGGSLPVVLAGYDQALDASGERFGELNPETGKTRRRSPFMLAQEALNASNKSLWAIASNGITLRILRDNPSLTRPAYVEVDLEAIFSEDLYADFTAFWLLAHASRFGLAASEPTDCPWERWRTAGQEVGVTVRLNLRYQVADALRALGTGFLSHPANSSLRASLNGQGEALSMSKQAFFEELLRLVYRLIFLATVEDRIDASTGQSLVFSPNASQEAKDRYKSGYSITWLRDRAVRRSSFDTHGDLWQALNITFDGLAQGQVALGLPALGGLYAADQCPNLATSQIENRHLLSAVFQLGYFRQTTGLTRVNYRDMGPEELGSVYESLLELVPDIQSLNQPHTAKLAFMGDEESNASTQGNSRKLTGSYYTPDSLVQALIKSTLEPVIQQTIQTNVANPVDALLQITVCDPACGSGHFLLAAARRLADEIARLRTIGKDAPLTPVEYRHALRDVVSHCIFGVDKNPLAISLAKTALWLEAYSSDRPLSFLDHHLRCGDALLGTLGESILESGIPDKAFNALSGDDNNVVKAIKKANRDALKSIAKAKSNDKFMLNLGLSPRVDVTSVEALSDDSLEELEQKRIAYAVLQSEIASSSSRLAADIFVAAFILPKTLENQDLIPTSQDLWLASSGDSPRPGIPDTARSAARAAQAFHWWLEFPAIKARGGFDVLLANPPWERIKLQEEEFFATRSPLVASAQNKSERGKRINLLEQGLLLHTLYPDVEAQQGLHPPNLAEKMLFCEFVSARRNAEAASLFAHESGRFPLTGVGDVNTYALFAESLLHLTRATGRAGFIVPTGIATDDSTKAFFSHITQTARLVSLYDIENRERLFPSVHSAMKFCLLTLGQCEEAEFICFASNVGQLVDPRRRFTLTPEDFRLINPNTLNCPVFRSAQDAILTKKLYKAAPVLCAEVPHDINPWKVRLTMMFHMANDSSLFHTVSNRNRLPLYEGKMCDYFDHRSGSYESRGDERGYRVLPATTFEQHSDPEFFVTPFYWVEKAEVLSRLPEDWSYSWLPVFKKVTSPTNERTFLTSLLPVSAVGDSMNLILPGPNIPPRKIAAFVGNLAALVLDYVARQKIGGVNTNFFHVKQLPILAPDSYDEDALDYIVPRITELSYTATDLKLMAHDFGYDGPPYPWNPDRRAKLRAELDAYYARLYGLNRSELCYILDPADVMDRGYPSETFRVLKSNEVREFGEYRTKRLILEAWDSLTQ